MFHYLLQTCTLKILEKASLRTQLADCVWAHFQEEIVPEIRAYQTAKDSEQTMSHQVIHNLRVTAMYLVMNSHLVDNIVCMSSDYPTDC